MVTLGAIVVLASLAVSVPTAGRGCVDRAKLIQTVNNGKQIITLATIMANDQADTKDPNLGWPGDLVSSPGEAGIASLGDYVDRMIKYDYVKRGDVGKVFGGPGVPPWDGSGKLTSKNCAFKIFKVTKADSGDVIFAETRNYSYNRPPDAQTKPFGDTCFVVNLKDTSSTSYQKQQYNLWPQIGTLPGHVAGEGEPAAETADMILP